MKPTPANGRKRKTWAEKLADDKGFPKVFPIDQSRSKRWWEGTFVIPAPMEVNELMRSVPKGKLTTIDQMRQILVRRHCATIACPITTGIFAWIAANAAAEATTLGKKSGAPYWRTLKSNGEINAKYPGSVPAAKRKLAAEGHKIVKRGKRFYVEGFEQHLAAF